MIENIGIENKRRTLNNSAVHAKNIDANFFQNVDYAKLKILKNEIKTNIKWKTTKKNKKN